MDWLIAHEHDTDIDEIISHAESYTTGTLLKWTNILQGYQERYFELRGKQLLYFKTISDATQKPNAPRGSIFLSNYVLEELVVGGNPLTFEIKRKKRVATGKAAEKSEFYLKARNEDEKNVWCAALRLIINDTPSPLNISLSRSRLDDSLLLHSDVTPSAVSQKTHDVSTVGVPSLYLDLSSSSSSITSLESAGITSNLLAHPITPTATLRVGSIPPSAPNLVVTTGSSIVSSEQLNAIVDTHAHTAHLITPMVASILPSAPPLRSTTSTNTSSVPSVPAPLPNAINDTHTHTADNNNRTLFLIISFALFVHTISCLYVGYHTGHVVPNVTVVSTFDARVGTAIDIYAFLFEGVIYPGNGEAPPIESIFNRVIVDCLVVPFLVVPFSEIVPPGSFIADFWPVLLVVSCIILVSFLSMISQLPFLYNIFKCAAIYFHNWTYVFASPFLFFSGILLLDQARAYVLYPYVFFYFRAGMVCFLGVVAGLLSIMHWMFTVQQLISVTSSTFLFISGICCFFLAEDVSAFNYKKMAFFCYGLSMFFELCLIISLKGLSLIQVSSFVYTMDTKRLACALLILNRLQSAHDTIWKRPFLVTDHLINFLLIIFATNVGFFPVIRLIKTYLLQIIINRNAIHMFFYVFAAGVLGYVSLFPYMPILTYYFVYECLSIALIYFFKICDIDNGTEFPPVQGYLEIYYKFFIDFEVCRPLVTGRLPGASPTLSFRTENEEIVYKQSTWHYRTQSRLYAVLLASLWHAPEVASGVHLWLQFGVFTESTEFRQSTFQLFHITLQLMFLYYLIGRNDPIGYCISATYPVFLLHPLQKRVTKEFIPGIFFLYLGGYLIIPMLFGGSHTSVSIMTHYYIMSIRFILGCFFISQACNFLSHFCLRCKEALLRVIQYTLDFIQYICAFANKIIPFFNVTSQTGRFVLPVICAYFFIKQFFSCPFSLSSLGFLFASGTSVVIALIMLSSLLDRQDLETLGTDLYVQLDCGLSRIIWKIVFQLFVKAVYPFFRSVFRGFVHLHHFCVFSVYQSFRTFYTYIVGLLSHLGCGIYIIWSHPSFFFFMSISLTWFGYEMHSGHLKDIELNKKILEIRNELLTYTSTYMSTCYNIFKVFIDIVLSFSAHFQLNLVVVTEELSSWYMALIGDTQNVSIFFFQRTNFAWTFYVGNLVLGKFGVFKYIRMKIIALPGLSIT